MQNDLQLLLLIIGMVIGVFLIYKSFREHHSNRKAPSIIRREFQKKIMEHTHKAAPHKKDTPLHMAGSDPLMDNHDFTYTAITIDTPEPSLEEAVPEPVAAKSAEVITLILIPRNTVTFSGAELSMIFEEEHYHHGKMNLFHCHEQNDPEQPVIYSIASMVKPGTFDLSTLRTENFHGLVLWMIFQPHSDPQVFEKMLNDAKRLAEKLNATLCDQTRKQLTVQATSQIRAKVKECCHSEPVRQSAY